MSGIPVVSIIDDDESVRTAIGDMVESFGFTVGAFASAEEFLRSERLHDTNVDVGVVMVHEGIPPQIGEGAQSLQIVIEQL